MPPKTRLDPLVKWKEREVERAKLELAVRLKALAIAQERIAETAAQLGRLPSQATSVDDLELLDRAVARGRADLEVAKKEWSEADQALRKSQAAYADVHRQAETFRRANDRQRAVLVQEIERQERKTLDEIANLLRER
jgi:flagellar biosynthesis chaperone FliJ